MIQSPVDAKKKKKPTKKPFLACTPSPRRPEIESRVTHPLLPAGVWWGKGSNKGKRKPEGRLEENRLESRGRETRRSGAEAGEEEDHGAGERGCSRGPESWRGGVVLEGRPGLLGKQEAGRSQRKLSTWQGSPRTLPDSGERWEPNDDGVKKGRRL